MERVYFIEYKGKKILYIDISNLKKDDEDLFLSIIDTAKKIIASQPLNSLLIITNFINSEITPKSTSVLKEFALHNKPYVKVAALIGIGGIKKILLDTISKFTNRKFYIFNNIDEAKEFLTSQE
ncbi:MAG: hypothetical protein N2114_06895 [Candidatus Goldbacteria bacterium]|nr:hypothetical protein [Candidatus Goldiibacteriota bacterium]